VDRPILGPLEVSLLGQALQHFACRGQRNAQGLGEDSGRAALAALLESLDLLEIVLDASHLTIIGPECEPE
jgi:hypothetical protein